MTSCLYDRTRRSSEISPFHDVNSICFNVQATSEGEIPLHNDSASYFYLSPENSSSSRFDSGK